MWFILLAWLFLSSSPAAELDTLNTQCFQQNLARACVRLGTTLWQTPSQRSLALRAFRKGCELKEPSACTLKEMKPPHTVSGPVGESKVPLPHEENIQGIRRIDAENYVLERDVALEYAADLPKTLEGVQIEASHKNGALEGWRIVDLNRDNILANLGFLKGDLILTVNGRTIGSTTEATALLATLAFEDKYLIRLRREGKILSVTYQLN